MDKLLPNFTSKIFDNLNQIDPQNNNLEVEDRLNYQMNLLDNLSDLYDSDDYPLSESSSNTCIVLNEVTYIQSENYISDYSDEENTPISSIIFSEDVKCISISSCESNTI